jgi:geranylgeranyl diphosphate synthase type II
MSDFYNILLQESKLIDSIIRSEFEKRKEDIYGTLYEAMEYSLFSGGKKVRPLLMKWCSEIGDPNKDVLAKAMSAIEYIHTYSLIHDDLPAMDDDDMRRGKPSSHKKFDEATAILAGDGLQTDAFLLLGQTGIPELSIELATCAGSQGMVGGQAADIKRDREIDYINDLKTANLFKAAAVMGGIVGGLNKDALDKLADYGINLGRAFQFRDDILDEEAADNNETYKKAAAIVAYAKNTIKDIPGTERLLELADFVIARKH